MTDTKGQLWGKSLIDIENDQKDFKKAKWQELTPEMLREAGYIHLPGATSTSVSFKVALNFALPSNDNKFHVPTLFVICCHNFDAFTGFRMDSALHSAHPTE